MENKQERKVDGIRGGWSTERECLDGGAKAGYRQVHRGETVM